MGRKSVTMLALNQLQENWSAKVQHAYAGLSTARDLISFLEDDRYCNNLGFSLVRFLQEHWGVRTGEQCVITVGPIQKTFPLLHCSLGAVVPPEEHGDYVRLLAALAAQNGLGDKFPPKVFRSYLSRKKDGLSRESCFQLSFAMGMDWNETCEFLEVMGQSPYQFRSPEECVYYFCQSSETMNRWETAQCVLEAYRQQCSDPSISERQAGQTQNIEWALTLLAEEADAMEDDRQRRSCIVDFLVRNAALLQGFSLSGHDLFVRKLEHVKELLNVDSDQEAAIAMWSPIWVQTSRKGRNPGKEEHERPGVQVQYDFVPFRDLVDLPKTLYEKPLWRARIRKIRNFEVPAEKRDILFLSLMEWIWSGEECGGLENMQRFLYQTNADLAAGGFSLIYPPNQYDRMILLAVCSEEPVDVLSDIFETATSEETLLNSMSRS